MGGMRARIAARSRPRAPRRQCSQCAITLTWQLGIIPGGGQGEQGAQRARERGPRVDNPADAAQGGTAGAKSGGGGEEE